MLTAKERSIRRTRRKRYSIAQKSRGRLRLSVYRSGMHIYAQVIDDKVGKTLAAASSVQKAVLGKLKTGANKEAAKVVGTMIAERAIKAGVKEVVFDCGGIQISWPCQRIGRGSAYSRIIILI